MNIRFFKLTFLVCMLQSCVLAFAASDDDGKYEMENLRAKIDVTNHKNSRFIDSKTEKSKDYIFGKSSSYNKKGEANAGSALQPYVEYQVETKLAGGNYSVVVYYRLNKSKTPDNPKVKIGMDLLDTQEVEVDGKGLNPSVKATFKVKLLKGKKHNIKLWLPSEGVEVHKIEVRNAIFSKK